MAFIALKKEMKSKMENKKAAAAFYKLINYLISENYGLEQFRVLQKVAQLLNYSKESEEAIIITVNKVVAAENEYKIHESLFNKTAIEPDEIAFQPGNSAWVLLQTSREVIAKCPCCKDTGRTKVNGYHLKWITCPECNSEDYYKPVDIWYTRKGVIKKRTHPDDKWFIQYELKVNRLKSWVKTTKLFRTKKEARAECARRNTVKGVYNVF